MNFKHYLNLAKLNHRLGDREIGARLNLTPDTLAAYRTGRAVPDAEVMIMLGNLAGAPQELALRDLAKWRAQPPRSRRRFSRGTPPSAVPLAGRD